MRLRWTYSPVATALYEQEYTLPVHSTDSLITPTTDTQAIAETR